MYRYSIDIKKYNIVIPNPIVKNLLKDIGYPPCSETPKAIKVLGEPMGVMLPPRFAPITNPHHKGSILFADHHILNNWR